MSTDLTRYGGGQLDRGRRGSHRPSLRERAVAEQADLELFRLVASGRHEEVKAIIRKRLTESGMEDIADVCRLAQDLAGGDPFVASQLIPIVQEYARTTARDIRDFGRGW